MAEAIQLQKIPNEEETLQGKMIGTIQRQELEEEEKLQMKSVVQRQEIQKEEETLQGKFEKSEQEACPSCSTLPIQREKENCTGIPDNLKAGVENLSGIDMSDVRVHYNSDKPAKVGALAYTQGTDIHVAPGQEKYLPHEAWHVVQQTQGRVKPTMQLKDVVINNDNELEHEADEMGRKTEDFAQTTNKESYYISSSKKYESKNNQTFLIQKKVGIEPKNPGEWRLRSYGMNIHKMLLEEQVFNSL
jgi:hypothetical protein